jgi:broad specificity phosphatase PhoE
MRRLVLLRHGETTGDSARRYHGSSDPDLAPAGREQMRLAAAKLRWEDFDVIAASPLRRAWQSAWVVAAGRPVALVAEFREIHFGRWEGLSREEIQASDPVTFEDWEKGAPGFEYPGGELRADFRARVDRGLRALAGRAEQGTCMRLELLHLQRVGLGRSGGVIGGIDGGLQQQIRAAKSAQRHKANRHQRHQLAGQPEFEPERGQFDAHVMSPARGHGLRVPRQECRGRIKQA